MHTGFAGWYNKWISEAQNCLRLSPDALNRRYNLFREVVLGLK